MNLSVLARESNERNTQGHCENIVTRSTGHLSIKHFRLNKGPIQTTGPSFNAAIQRLRQPAGDYKYITSMVALPSSSISSFRFKSEVGATKVRTCKVPFSSVISLTPAATVSPNAR